MTGVGLVQSRRGRPLSRSRKPVGHWANPEDISLDSRFADLLPPTADENRQLTEEAVFRDGLAEPLIVWRRHDRKILLIGYEVFPILRLYRIAFRIIEKEFPSVLAAELFVLRYSLSRNRLTPLQASYLRGLRYNGEKLPHGGDHSGQNDHLISREPANCTTRACKTATALGEIFHVGERTIRRDGALAVAVQQIASNCGGRDARDLLLKPGIGLTHGRILAWTQLPPSEQKARLLHLRLRGKCPRANRETDEPLTITVPRRPAHALAQGIFDRLGRLQATRVRDSLNALIDSTQDSSNPHGG